MKRGENPRKSRRLLANIFLSLVKFEKPDEADQRVIEAQPVPSAVTSMGSCALKHMTCCVSATAATRGPPPLFKIVSQRSMLNGLRIFCIAARGRIAILRRTSFRQKIPPPLLVTQARVSSAEPSGVSTRCLTARRVPRVQPFLPAHKWIVPQLRSSLPSRRSILPHRNPASLDRSRTGAPRGARGVVLLRNRPRDDMGASQ